MSTFRFLIFFTGFAEGSVLTGLQITGARLFAPYYGNSVHVWTAVILSGLLALGAGYLRGSKLDHQKNKRNLVHILLACSIWILLLYFFSGTILSSTLFLPLPAGVTLAALILLAPCFYLLGSVTPLLTMLLNLTGQSPADPGKLIALSTSGGVFMCLVSGLYLVPLAGVQFTLLLFVSLLFVPAILAQLLIKSRVK